MHTEKDASIWSAITAYTLYISTSGLFGGANGFDHTPRIRIARSLYQTSRAENTPTTATADQPISRDFDDNPLPPVQDDDDSNNGADCNTVDIDDIGGDVLQPLGGNPRQPATLPCLILPSTRLRHREGQCNRSRPKHDSRLSFSH